MTRGRAAGAFCRGLDLAGWSLRSQWGFDPELECYWAELWRADADARPAVRISPAHLVPTMSGLARAVASATGAGVDEAFLGLTATAGASRGASSVVGPRL